MVGATVAGVSGGNRDGSSIPRAGLSTDTAGKSDVAKAAAVAEPSWSGIVDIMAAVLVEVGAVDTGCCGDGLNRLTGKVDEEGEVESKSPNTSKADVVAGVALGAVRWEGVTAASEGAMRCDTTESIKEDTVGVT